MSQKVLDQLKAQTDGDEQTLAVELAQLKVGSAVGRAAKDVAASTVASVAAGVLSGGFTVVQTSIPPSVWS